MEKGKRTTYKQLPIYKRLHRKLKIEQHEPPLPKKKERKTKQKTKQKQSWSERRCRESDSSSCPNIEVRYVTVKQHEHNLICKSYLTPR